ncbi:MAG: xanthine dehydrogenase family protein molybdopterin-binding subunit, partial [Fidelibacterota bacterium]
GATRFLTDQSEKDMIFAYPIFSKIPFGQIIEINTKPAESVSGYIGTFTARDIPGENQVGVIMQDQPLIANNTVRFIGDVVGVTVADSWSAAQESASKVEVLYKILPPVFTIDESKNSKGRTLHKNNIACTHQVINGDVNTAFKNSDHVIEADFSTHTQEHYYLEPQGCIVIPKNNGFKIIGSLQCPYYIRKAIMVMSGYALENIVVEQAPTGGAFGGKEDVPSEVCARTALVAMKLNKTVKMVYSRNDDIQFTSKRHPFQMHYKVGVNSSGKILAAEVLLEENAGAYATLSGVVSYRSSIQGLGPYCIPNVKMRSISYYTNLPPNGAFRGFGSPQAAFGHERMMDIVADQIGMDPVEFRLKNIIRDGDKTITGQQLSESVSAQSTLENVLNSEKNNSIKLNTKDDSRFLYGTGFAVTHYGNCLGAAGWHLDGSGARLHIHENGLVDVAFGLVEMGQGALTSVAQMTAESLGVDISRIQVLPTRSDRLPDSGPSVASRNIVMTGSAILDAASKLLPVIQKSASELFNCSPDQIQSSNDRVINNKTGDSLSFNDVVHYMFENNINTQSEGWWHVPQLIFDADKGRGEAYFTYSYATHLANVRVDKITGMVYVDKIRASHDVGRAINPAGIEGQVEGGISQGVGWALTENFRFTNGKVMTPNLATYLLPTAVDVPEVDTDIIENPEPKGPWGAKGVGEPAIIPTAAAIANAVSNAINRPINHLPITPEKILNLIEGNLNE